MVERLHSSTGLGAAAHFVFGRRLRSTASSYRRSERISPVEHILSIGWKVLVPPEERGGCRGDVPALSVEAQGLLRTFAAVNSLALCAPYPYVL